jgi:hypothetical protein
LIVRLIDKSIADGKIDIWTTFIFASQGTMKS